VYHVLRSLAASLIAISVLATPARAADDDEMMDKIDPPGGKSKAPVKPLAPKMKETSPPILPPEGADQRAAVPEGIDPKDGTPLVPAIETSRRLATETLLSFHRAVRSKSFTAFQVEMLSKAFAEQYSTDKLLETFRPFIEADANLAGIENVEPVFDPAPFVENNLLKLQGRFPTSPMLVKFDLDFALEKGAWKLNAMTLSLRGTPPQIARGTGATGGGASANGAPSDAELAALVAGTLMDFNSAVKAGDFTKLHAKASRPMRWQTKPPKLKEAFAQFIQNGTDISTIVGAEPQFDGPPKIDGQTDVGLRALPRAAAVRDLQPRLLPRGQRLEAAGPERQHGLSRRAQARRRGRRRRRGDAPAAPKEPAEGAVDPEPCRRPGEC
jgi:hypothetical protein